MEYEIIEHTVKWQKDNAYLVDQLRLQGIELKPGKRLQMLGEREETADQVATALINSIDHAPNENQKRIYIALLCRCNAPFDATKAYQMFDSYTRYIDRRMLGQQLAQSHAIGLVDWLKKIFRDPSYDETEDTPALHSALQDIASITDHMVGGQGKELLGFFKERFDEYGSAAIGLFGKYGGVEELALLKTLVGNLDQDYEYVKGIEKLLDKNILKLERRIERKRLKAEQAKKR